MKVIRHAGVDSRRIILDDQARQQMTLHFQLSLSMQRFAHHGFVRHAAAASACLTKPALTITDESNKRLEKSVSLWASVSEQPT